MRVDQYDSIVKVALSEAQKQGIYVIVRLEDTLEANVNLLNGKPQDKQLYRLRGMGISAFTEDGSCSFGSTDELTKSSVRSLVRSIADMAKSSSGKGVQKNTEIYNLDPLQAEQAVSLLYPIESLDLNDLEEALNTAHGNIRKFDKKMTVTSEYKQHEQQWWIARSDGTNVKFTIPMSVIKHDLTKKKHNTTRESGLRHVGYDASLLYGLEDISFLEHKVKGCYDILDPLLNAEMLPAGHYKAVLPPGFAGVFTHEAVGHAVESDSMHISVLGKDGKVNLGAKVAQDNISVIDGPVDGQWGYLKYSMNGVPRKTVTFIKDGILVDSLSDVFSASRAGTEINGAGRSHHFLHPAIPRMSSTRLMDKNAADVDVHPEYTTVEELYDILHNRGEFKDNQPIVMPVQSKGGQVIPQIGSYMFNGRAIYKFEPRGPNRIKLYGPSSFSGDTLGTLITPMSGIGQDLILDDGGFCGKAGQTAWVSDGSHPYLILDKTEAVTFGGQ